MSGALLGTGLVPAGPIGFELEATVRRVFAQMVVVLLYKQNPLLALLLRNAIRASGGIAPYVQPVQTGKYVHSSWIGPAGQFDIPPDVAATLNASFNLCALATPVTTMGLEQLVTQDAVAVTSRLMLKMNDMKNSALEKLAGALFSSNRIGGETNVVQMFGLLDAYGDQALSPVYGGISREEYPNWQGLVINGAGEILTRKAIIPYLLRAAKHGSGEALDFVVMSIEDWTTLLQDFIQDEQIGRAHV